MSAIPSDLADLRRHIDEIDDRLHDLLIERAEVVARVAASKRDGEIAFYQPGREAEILRRLARRHHGVLEFGTVVRIWRELLAATVRLETPFAVAVFAPTDGHGFWDLARDHYGSHARMFAHGSIGRVIRAVAAGQAAVGVLPMPREDDPDPWWPRLFPADVDTPRVIARLPFGDRGNARGDAGDALAIGLGTQHQTGADRTLIAIRPGAELSRARFLRLLESLGLACLFLAVAEQPDGRICLTELDGFVKLADPRLARLRAELGIPDHHLFPFGGYALPLPPQALAGGAANG